MPRHHVDRRPKRSRLAILHVEQYSQKIDEILAAGLRLFRIDVRAKRVVIKPNLVDYAPGDAINTHPLLVLAAAESFRRMGAKYVIRGAGTSAGHAVGASTEWVSTVSTGRKDSIRRSQSR